MDLPVVKYRERKEFCRRGQMQQKSGDACAGMPERRYGAKVTD